MVEAGDGCLEVWTEIYDRYPFGLKEELPCCFLILAQREGMFRRLGYTWRRV